jgi:hypothetical protein
LSAVKKTTLVFMMLAIAAPIAGINRLNSFNKEARIYSTIADRAADEARRGNELKNGSTLIVSGIPFIEKKVTDPVFGISFDTLSFHRQAEIMQWTQTCSGGKAPNCQYIKVLSPHEVSSEQFKISFGHENYGRLAFKSIEQKAEFSIAGVPVDGRFTEFMAELTPVPITTEQYEATPTNIKRLLKLNGGKLVSQHSLGIGDQVYSFKGLEVKPYTLVGEVYNGKLRPLKKNPHLWVAQGIHDIEAMKNKAAFYVERQAFKYFSGVVCAFLIGLVGMAISSVSGRKPTMQEH